MTVFNLSHRYCFDSHSFDGFPHVSLIQGLIGLIIVVSMEMEFVIPLNIDDLLHNESPLYVVQEVATLRELPSKIQCKFERAFPEYFFPQGKEFC